MAQFLGNKVEMAITKAVEGNKSLLKVGLHFEFGDCRYVLKYLFRLVLYVCTYLQVWNHIFFSFRNRVAVQLQKNLDRVRLRRIQQKVCTKICLNYEIRTNNTTHHFFFLFAVEHERDLQSPKRPACVQRTWGDTWRRRLFWGQIKSVVKNHAFKTNFI